ncbi:Protein of unknown function [Sporobacter termitidis DSM 10068]|uniref:DUF2953 domain-containing protein n=1 Tax=Sporobacter termitidis DSM 10068 TaxID=1123282 RepID=A0A1M5TJJ2_9FIRM|nr:DUF2953 domain-containing protein [Sporobacter termitidis]SHH50942.1 Protein of unknown function [Sporobacter termitidis DSM 10068]
MIALAIVLAIVLLVCLLRVGVVVEYGEDGFTADGTVGPVSFRLAPRKEKNKGKRKQNKKAAEATVKLGRLTGLKNQLPSIRQALSRLRRKLRVNELTIYYMAAGSDPAAAAMYFGAASAGYGFLLPILENSFKIKKRDLRASVNFEETEPYIYLRAKLSLAVWEAFYVGFGLFKNIIKSENMRAKIRKAV